MSILHEIVRSSRTLAPSTREHYLRDLDAWIAFVGDDPANWTRTNAQAFYDHLIDGKRLAPRSANRYMAGLQYASKWWAHRQNKPELDFAYVQKAPNLDNGNRRALTQDEAIALVQACRGPEPADLRDLAIVVVGLETGMRRMSMISMALEHTRLDAIKPHYPVAFVTAKGTRGQRVPVPLSDTALAALSPWHTWLGMHGITKGPTFQALDERLAARGANVIVASKKPLSEPAIGGILERRRRLAGIEHVYPHMFRHTFVTWRTAAGLAPHEIAAITLHTIPGLGAISGYMDMTALAEKVRNSTPEWLRDLVHA